MESLDPTDWRVQTYSCRLGNPTTTAGEKRSLRRARPANEGAGQKAAQVEGAALGGTRRARHHTACAEAKCVLMRRYAPLPPRQRRLGGVVSRVHQGGREVGAPRVVTRVRGGDVRRTVLLTPRWKKG